MEQTYMEKSGLRSQNACLQFFHLLLLFARNCTYCVGGSDHRYRMNKFIFIHDVCNLISLIKYCNKSGRHM